jgi:hypothetical protein
MISDCFHRPDEISATEISLGRQRPQYHLPELPQINRSARFSRADGQIPVTSSRATGQARRMQRCFFLFFAVDPPKILPDRKDGKL